MSKRFENLSSSTHLPKIIHSVTISADTEQRMLWSLNSKTAQHCQGVRRLGWMIPVPSRGWWPWWISGCPGYMLIHYEAPSPRGMGNIWDFSGNPVLAWRWIVSHILTVSGDVYQATDVLYRCRAKESSPYTPLPY